MSGLVAVLRTSNAPLDPHLIDLLTAALAVRGPDGSATRQEGAVALGHSVLWTGDDQSSDRQPLTIDGRTWIVVDGRVDGRATLAADVGIDRAGPLDVVSDAELILRAYGKWSDKCVDGLLGDFAFAIWDGAGRRLFCARDHLGIKPLYYASVGDWLVVASSIDCVLGHHAVTGTLDELAIADFLLFGHNATPMSTAFRDIKRVPPAHTLTWSSSAGLRLRRYWELPVEEPVYRQDEDYVAQFRTLLRQAVSDRLRTRRVSVFLSGGLDSTALAAVASNELGAGSLRGVTFVYRSLIEDREKEPAALAARELGLDARCVVVDEKPGWPESLVGNAPEPFAAVIDAAYKRCYAEMASHSRVALFGEGPDNAMAYDWKPYLTYLYRSRRWTRMAADGAKYLMHHRRPPFVRTAAQLLTRAVVRGSDVPIPRWMDPGLVDRLRLKDRWREVMGPLQSRHPVRPTAHASLVMPLWHTIFDGFEPSCTGAPLEVRYPYLDIRLLRFLLRLPVVPWCRDKHLFRYALRGILPRSVLRRQKTPLNGDPDVERVRRYGLPPLRWTPRLERFGAPDRLHELTPVPDEISADLRFVALSHWFAQLDEVRPADLG